MTSKYFLILIFSLTSNFAMSSTLNCRAADGDNGNPIEVTPDVVSGAQVPNETRTNYGDYALKVTFNKGNGFEGQTFIKLEANGAASITYNVSHESLYMLQMPDLIFQCWFSN